MGVSHGETRQMIPESHGLKETRAVIFDLDGLLIDSEPVYRMAWQRAATTLGHTISDDLYLSLLGRTIKEGERVLDDIFHNFPRKEFHSLWTEIWRDYVYTQGIPLKFGAEELLDFLEEEEIPRAVATSSNREEAILSLGEFRERFDETVTGDQVSRGKPSPEIFLVAATLLNVPAEACLVLEDSEAGVQAAWSAGMPSIMVPDLKQPSEEILSMVYGVCSSLYEVKDILVKELINTK